MKTSIKLALLFFITGSIFTSCKTYQVVHYKRSEIPKISDGFNDDSVYIHDQHSIYKVVKPSLALNEVKGTLVPISDSAKLAELKDLRTQKQLKTHKHDLNIYTKAEVKDLPDGGVLKKEDITDISKVTPVPPKFDVALFTEILLVAALGTLVWVAIISSFGGLL